MFAQQNIIANADACVASGRWKKRNIRSLQKIKQPLLRFCSRRYAELRFRVYLNLRQHRILYGEASRGTVVHFPKRQINRSFVALTSQRACSSAIPGKISAAVGVDESQFFSDEPLIAVSMQMNLLLSASKPVWLQWFALSGLGVQEDRRTWDRILSVRMQITAGLSAPGGRWLSPFCRQRALV